MPRSKPEPTTSTSTDLRPPSAFLLLLGFNFGGRPGGTDMSPSSLIRQISAFRHEANGRQLIEPHGSEQI